MRALRYIVPLCVGSLLTLAQTSARLETANTVLQLEARTNAPRLVTISSPGQLAWTNASDEQLIGSVIIDNNPVPVHWQFDPGASSSDSHQVTFIYLSQSPRLRLSWRWQARAPSGPIEHEIHIQNLEDREVWLPLQPSFQFDWKIHSPSSLKQLYVEKGANTPSEVGTHLDSIVARYNWRGTSSTYGHPKENESREIIPWFLVEETGGSKIGWYVGIEFSGRT